MVLWAIKINYDRNTNLCGHYNYNEITLHIISQHTSDTIIKLVSIDIIHTNLMVRGKLKC